VQLKILRATGKDMTLTELGLSDGAKEILLGRLNKPGLTIISSPPREGLSSTWRAALLGMDRFTRDCVAIIDDQDAETEIENLNAKKYPQGTDPAAVIRNTLLTQPDALVVPQFANPSVMDHLADEALNHNRAIITQIQANSASEALLKLYAQSKSREAFAKAITLVTCQRLVRKLCNDCKVPFPVKPDFVQRLGGNPNTVQAIFRPFVPPPLEQQVDEAGKPLEIPICSNCQGLGYLGRTVVIELLVMNDPIRKVLKEQPQVAAINEISRRTGNLDLMGQAYQLVLQGDTSIEEVKRVFQVKS
jgi:type II secretory ATPase GspE/PulE/Tfp pilus assembly ATPase PilB-like protein